MFLKCIYVNSTSAYPFARDIVDGEKTVETRSRRTLDRFIGQRVGIVERRNGKRTLIGVVTITGCFEYADFMEYDRDYERHLVGFCSDYYWTGEGHRYGYTLADPHPLYNPVELTSGDIIRHDRQSCTVEILEVW